MPHFTTLIATATRLLTKPRVDQLLATTLALCRKARLLKRRSPLAAIDSTGLETRHVSATLLFHVARPTAKAQFMQSWRVRGVCIVVSAI